MSNSGDYSSIFGGGAANASANAEAGTYELITLAVLGGMTGALVMLLIAIYGGDALRGPPGKKGDKGPNGDNGDHGDHTDGMRGNQIFVDAGPPSALAAGLNSADEGDIYIDSLTSDLYQFQSGAWVPLFNLGVPAIIPSDHQTQGIWTFNRIALTWSNATLTTLTTLNPITSSIRLIAGVAGQITGINAGSDGQLLTVVNTSGAAATWAAGGNIFLGGVNQSDSGYGRVILQYDATSLHWVMLSASWTVLPSAPP